MSTISNTDTIIKEWLDLSDDAMRFRCGEMTQDGIPSTVRAVLMALQRQADKQNQQINLDQAIINRALAYIPYVRVWRMDNSENMAGREYVILPPNSVKLAFIEGLEFPEIYVPGCLAFSGAVPPDVYYSEGPDPRRGSTHWRKLNIPAT
jgi:hypothetical protein